MAYCPECGSEVAENDIFCAYCGITLPKVLNETEAEKSPVENPPTSDLAVETPSANLVRNIEMSLEGKTADVTLPNETPNVLLDSSKIVETTEENSFEDTDEEISNEIKEADAKKEISDKDEIVSKVENADAVESSEKAKVIFDEVETESETQTESNEPELFEKEEVDVKSEETPQELEYSNEQIDDEISDELMAIETPASEIKEEKISEVVDSGIDEISEKKEEKLTFEPAIDFDNTIPDSYLPPKVEIESEEPASNSEKEDEEKLQSVLDEIDQNLKSQNESETENSDEPFVNSGVIVPTAANLQDEVFPPPSTEEQISVPLANFAPVIDIEKDLEIKEEVSEQVPPVSEKLSESIVEEEKVSALDEEKEARAFTNPNMGKGDTDNRSKTKLKPLDEGTVLNNRYEIVRKIGGGGMGAVYLATDKNLGGVLRAVKEMVQSYIEDEQQEKAVSDFKRESLLLTSLEHSAIPTIYDYFYDEKEGRFYLVMKYISGGDLAARLRSAPEGRIDEVSVTDWAIQIADVLDYLHNRQPPIVYRDLKPSNIMIDGDTGRKAMLIDFGIARWVSSKEEKGVTAVGTMGYAPPELFSGNVEPRSDIYSLGSTMFHLLTGADPQSNPLLIFDFNKNPKPRQINSQLSDQMEQILMRSVEYNSTNRFNTAKEMREALIQHLENLKKGAVTFGVVNTSASSSITGNVPVFCGFCGQKILTTDMFCPFCGSQQPQIANSKQVVQSPPTFAPPSVFPKLAIVGTNDLEANQYVLEKESNLLGRRDPMSNIFPEVDLSKFDPQTKISRRHARVWREGDVYMLEDLGSSNGTTVTSIVNGSIRLLPRQPQVLSHGDTIKLGDTVLRFTVG